MRLGVSAVQHDMKREETVEEVEKNTEWQRRTPKRQATGSNPAGGARFSVKSPCCKGFCFFTLFGVSLQHTPCLLAVAALFLRADGPPLQATHVLLGGFPP